MSCCQPRVRTPARTWSLLQERVQGAHMAPPRTPVALGSATPSASTAQLASGTRTAADVQLLASALASTSAATASLGGTATEIGQLQQTAELRDIKALLGETSSLLTQLCVSLGVRQGASRVTSGEHASAQPAVQQQRAAPCYGTEDVAAGVVADRPDLTAAARSEEGARASMAVLAARQAARQVHAQPTGAQPATDTPLCAQTQVRAPSSP